MSTVCENVEAAAGNLCSPASEQCRTINEVLAAVANHEWRRRRDASYKNVATGDFSVVLPDSVTAYVEVIMD